MSKAIYLCSTHGYFDVDLETGSVSTAGRPDTGGQTVYTVELAKALGRAGHPTFLVVRWFDIKLPELQKIGPSAWILRLRAGDFEFVPKEHIYTVLPWLVDNLTSFIRGEWVQMFREANLDPPETVEPALFHGHYVDGGIVAQAASRVFHVPFFWTSHSLGALKRERMGGDPDKAELKFNFKRRVVEETRLIEKALVYGGMTVTANTEVVDIRRLYHLDASLAGFIPPGVDTLKFRPLQPGEEEFPVAGLPQSSGPMIVMGGRFARTKGFELGLQAFQYLQTEFPDSTLVVFGGSDNPSEEERETQGRLHALREKYGISRKVFFLGARPQDELPSLYRRARVFIHPSRHEPFGMVSLEAVACGAPVVVSSHAGVSKELVHGQHGLVANPENHPEFAEAIMGLLRDPLRAQAMAHAGLAHINDHFSWSRIAAKHLAFWADKGAQL